jgi:pyruvate,water dikinase
MTTTVLPLHQATDRERCGGKAAALARLYQADLPVPDGLVIPVAAADELLPHFVEEILAWAAKRAPYGLIARSSAVAEDGTDSSFAGLFTSRFTPADADQLLDAVRAVRDSADTPVVRAYAQARGVELDGGMAVLVQPAVRPAAAGVLAAEIEGGRCARWRIEAVRGLAEPLVNGTLAGEIHTGRRHDAEPVVPANQSLIHLPGSREELLLPPGEWATAPGTAGHAPAKIATSHDGIVQLHLPRQWAGSRILGPRERDALLDHTVAAASALGIDRIDVEWAIPLSATDAIVLQARPLTRPLTPDFHPTANATDGWRGIPAVPGTVTGPAVLLTDGATVQDAVLICGALGPEAATALLQRPAAVVSTTGGPLSHTAILARELGIPCVTNVTGAAHEIAVGTLLEVDGTEGTVRPAAALPTPRPAPGQAAAGTAVLVRRADPAPPADGRAATILLDDPQGTDPSLLLPSCAPAPRTLPPTGILLLVEDQLTTPPGWASLPVTGIGRLLWPEDADAPPSRLVVVGPDTQILFERTLAIGVRAR